MGLQEEKEYYSAFPERYSRTLDAPGWAREIDGARLTVGQVNCYADLINANRGDIQAATAAFREIHRLVVCGCCFKKWRLSRIK